MFAPLIACICLQGATVNLPPGYYTAEDLARELSSAGERILASDDLDNRLYAARLRNYPRTDFIQLLEKGLGLAIVERNGRRYLAVEPAERRSIEGKRRSFAIRLDRFARTLCAEAEYALAERQASGVLSGKVKPTLSNGNDWVRNCDSFFQYASLTWLKQHGASPILAAEHTDSIPYSALLAGKKLPSRLKQAYRERWPVLEQNTSYGYLDASKLYSEMVSAAHLDLRMSFNPTLMAVTVNELVDGGEFGWLEQQAIIGVPGLFVQDLDEAGANDGPAELERVFGKEWLSYSTNADFASEMLLDWAEAKNLNMVSEVSVAHDRACGPFNNPTKAFRPNLIGSPNLLTVAFKDRTDHPMTWRMIPKAVANGLAIRSSTSWLESAQKVPVPLLRRVLANPKQSSDSYSMIDLMDRAGCFDAGEVQKLAKYDLNYRNPVLMSQLAVLKVLGRLPSSGRRSAIEKLRSGSVVIIGIKGWHPTIGWPILDFCAMILKEEERAKKPLFELAEGRVEDANFLLLAKPAGSGGEYEITVVLNAGPSPYAGTDRVADQYAFMQSKYLSNGTLFKANLKADYP